MQKINLNLETDFPKHMFTVINDPVTIKTNPYILILIPSKDRNDLLFNCIDALNTHTSIKLTNINVCIIDTGSTKDNLKEVEDYMSNSDSHLMMSLEKHDFYNFAKNNNKAFKDQNGKKYDYVLFCNNDVQILNDVLSHMISVFETEKKVGTVGIRLHFGDGTIQHLGAFCNMTKDLASPGHFAFGRVITGSILLGKQVVPANTAGFLMMKATLFDNLMFSEDYNECFEDVELNIRVGMKGFTNYCNLSAAAFHFESQSRNKDSNKQEKQNKDLKILSRFILTNKTNSYIKQKILQ